MVCLRLSCQPQPLSWASLMAGWSVLFPPSAAFLAAFHTCMLPRRKDSTKTPRTEIRSKAPAPGIIGLETQLSFLLESEVSSLGSLPGSLETWSHHSLWVMSLGLQEVRKTDAENSFILQWATCFPPVPHLWPWLEKQSREYFQLLIPYYASCPLVGLGAVGVWGGYHAVWSLR